MTGDRRTSILVRSGETGRGPGAVGLLDLGIAA